MGTTIVKYHPMVLFRMRSGAIQWIEAVQPSAFVFSNGTPQTDERKYTEHEYPVMIFTPELFQKDAVKYRGKHSHEHIEFGKTGVSGGQHTSHTAPQILRPYTSLFFPVVDDS